MQFPRRSCIRREERRRGRERKRIFHISRKARSCPKRILGNSAISWQGKTPDSHFTYFFYKGRATQSYQQNTASIEVFSFQKLPKLYRLVLEFVYRSKGQRDSFTREPPCLQQSMLGVPVCMKPSLTSVSRRPDTHGSYVTFMRVESWTEMSIAGKDQHVNFFGRIGIGDPQNIYACADGMLEQKWKTQYLQTWRWSVVPNESSRDFGPCDRFWTQLALRCFLLPTSPPGTALRERYVGP